jgi:hypothetical protein
VVVLLGQESDLRRAKAKAVCQVHHVGHQVHESGLVIARPNGVLPGADNADRVSWCALSSDVGC